MLARVRPLDFVRATRAGRTNPSILLCERSDKSVIDVVAKFSAGCFALSGLAFEAVGACLAGDLALPVPEPLLVEIPAGWSDAVSDESRRVMIQKSLPMAFGSKLATAGYGAWHAGARLTPAMMPVAAAIFVFDAIVQNPDRRVENPNCLVRGEDLLIFDHELAFGKILQWKPPWELGGLQHLEQSGKHIFREHLQGKAIDLMPIRARWAGLSDACLKSYVDALPVEWAAALAEVEEAIDLVRAARDNIDGCLREVQRVLT